VVVLTTCDGDGGGYGRRLGLQGGRERERDDRKLGGRRLHFFFFSLFAPEFLHAQAMKSISIYRGWRREVLSLMVKILALGSARKDPNRWFKVTP
jgi:hypothetical protein